MYLFPRPAATRLSAALAGLTLVAALGGCVVAPAPHRVYAPAPEVVMVAPPPNRMEVIGVAPYPGAVWIGGYWGWSGARHEWVPGRWAQPPQPGRHWVPHEWHGSDRDGYRVRGGHWSH